MPYIINNIQYFTFKIELQILFLFVFLSLTLFLGTSFIKAIIHFDRYTNVSLESSWEICLELVVH